MSVAAPYFPSGPGSHLIHVSQLRTHQMCSAPCPHITLRRVAGMAFNFSASQVGRNFPPQPEQSPPPGFRLSESGRQILRISDLTTKFA